jgi:hypothetical protein
VGDEGAGRRRICCREKNVWGGRNTERASEGRGEPAREKKGGRLMGEEGREENSGRTK